MAHSLIGQLVMATKCSRCSDEILASLVSPNTFSDFQGLTKIRNVNVLIKTDTPLLWSDWDKKSNTPSKTLMGSTFQTHPSTAA